MKMNKKAKQRSNINILTAVHHLTFNASVFIHRRKKTGMKSVTAIVNYRS